MQQVREWLGDPFGQTEPYPKRARGGPTATAWEFGCLELGFFDNAVHYLGFDFHYRTLPDFIVIDGYFPSISTDVNEFTAFLQQEAISYANYKPLTFEDLQAALIMGAGATAVFAADDGLLGSIYYSETRLPNR